MRNEQASRLIHLLRFFASRKEGGTISEIHTFIQNQGFEVSKRTLYRDIEALALSGYPVFQIEHESLGDTLGSRWVIEQNVTLLKLPRLEKNDLALAQRILVLCTDDSSTLAVSTKKAILNLLGQTKAPSVAKAA